MCRSLCREAGGSVPDEVQDDLSTVRAYPVFEEVDALPGSQGEFAFDERDRQLHLGEGCLQMSRHVVRAFGVMPVGTGLGPGLGREAIEEGLEVGAHGRIGVLLDQKRRGGVPAEDGEETGVHRLLAHPLVDGGRAFVEPLAPGCDFEDMRSLLHTRFDADGEAPWMECCWLLRMDGVARTNRRCVQQHFSARSERRLWLWRT